MSQLLDENSNPEREENEIVNAEEHSADDGATVSKLKRLGGMYEDWFLDYASYVILERAVPHINDGLKPVQRRILHAMKRMDDGRYNKVANVIGYTMQYHPHGDASIGDALVQLGQKDLLVDTQGNWGNILTGDSSAAPRYIEARLSKLALDIVFNPKTTEWRSSYDGRNKEPITLPVKFPLLLAQGVEGIAVGLASKILPHNFNELIDASVAYLKGEQFEIHPDFPTGGMADVSRYNDGLRGGAVKVRAKLTKVDNKTLSITQLPYGKNTTSLIESILKANDKGKIKIKKIDDNTAADVEILVHLGAGVSPDKTIDALYAFTDCEVSISPNCCIIEDEKPRFIGVSEILRHNTDQTKALLTLELEIRLRELEDAWHKSSLERIFIENRIYRNMEDSPTMEHTIKVIDEGLEPFKSFLRREVVQEDIERLTEIRMKRITAHDAKKADEYIKSLEEEMTVVKGHLAKIVQFTIDYYKEIQRKYGKKYPRKTELRSFETIEASKVVVANQKLYMNREEGFIGTALKKDEFVCDCSDIDDIIVFRNDGSYQIFKVTNKTFVGKDILHAAVFKKNDKRTIYNLVYRDGKNGIIYMKRCAITGLVRDKEYTITQGKPDSKIMYFSSNPNGEAELLKVYLRPKPRLKKTVLTLDFSELAVKGKASMGNILTRNAIHRIILKDKGVSTLGGRKVWFDETVMRLNVDGRGKFLGEFQGDDKILITTKDGKYRLSNFDLSNHFEDNIDTFIKFDEGKGYAAIFFDADQNYYYLKRFTFDKQSKLTSFIGDNSKSRLFKLFEDAGSQVIIKFGGENEGRENELVVVESFIGVKSLKARGKRLTTFEIKDFEIVEPIITESSDESNSDDADIADTEIEFEEENSDKQMSLEL
ncbi:MAG: DNA gyrase/topoisomerase IV subunit A [Bacteroidales bacterium]|jgi:topoisomerase-4 subunit A|nr:DNA gyrase/topoisomerase IV subunit A [Bacteroidales bacterium]